MEGGVVICAEFIGKAQIVYSFPSTSQSLHICDSENKQGQLVERHEDEDLQQGHVIRLLNAICLVL